MFMASQIDTDVEHRRARTATPAPPMPHDDERAHMVTPDQFESDGDAQELADDGYEQELKRTLSPWAVFALGFATISPVVGIYAVVQLGFAFSGPAWIWAVLVAFIGQLLVATVYAQLASQFPMTGGVYQWVRRLAGPKLG